MFSWKLRTLGPAMLERDGKAIKLERKSAALVTYLALAGATTRSRLAGLLWPDVTEAVARNNLAQALFRLRRQVGDTLFAALDPIELGGGVCVDVLDLRRSLLAGQGQRTLEHPGVLLGSFDYDDLPEFAEWVWSEREKLDALWTEAGWAAVSANEAQGAYEAALQQTEALLRHDPLSEAAYRQLMRLHYLLGDRAAAVRAYRRCEAVLAAELSMEPLANTRELLRRIEHDEVSAPLTLRQRELPIEVLRPPVLVGREAAWQQLEVAWEQRQTIYITGEPGVGKTRLAQEFLASKGRALYLPAQPGLQHVPFASAASLARTRMAEAREVVLPEWVRRELSRILPELRDGEWPPPMQAEEDRLRFFQAYAEMVRLTGAGFVASISDDVQYYDRATVELGAFLTSYRPAQDGLPAIPRYVIVYRRGELPAASQAVIDRFVAAGSAARIELEPLDEAATALLLASLKLSNTSDALPSALYRRTGGNPLFILETLRSLVETDNLATSADAPLSERVDAMVRQRLTRLSPTALRVAQAAAVLKSEFTPVMVGEMLQLAAHEHLSAWEELEQAQILTMHRFSHDLVFEAVAAGISPSVRMMLERRAAEVLSGRPVDPVRVAGHYLACGDALAAAPFLLQAARHALAQLRVADAERHFDHLITILEEHGRKGELAEIMAERERSIANPADSS